MNADSVCSHQGNPADIGLGNLQASIFRLITLYTVMPCPGKARTIVQLLKALIQHPDLAREPLQQQIYLQMLDTWQQLAQEPIAVRCVDHDQSIRLH